MIMMIKEDLVESIKPRVQKVCRDYDVIVAYLHGSFTEGKQHPESDIDIAVYFKEYSLKKLLEVSRRIHEEIDLDREIDITALNKADPRFQFRVIQKGNILYQTDPKERADIEVMIDRKYHDIKHHLEEHWEERKKKVIEGG